MSAARAERTRRAQRACALLASLTLTAVTGCGTAPPVQPEGQINVLPERPSLRTDPGRPAARHAARCAVRTVTLPLNRPVEAAWATLDEGVLPALSRAVWNANGLRLGVLDAKDAGDFGSALGPPDRLTDQVVVAIDRKSILCESPLLRADFVADLTRPPAPQHTEAFTRGRARMLISAGPSTGGATLELTPQHFMQRASLLVRDPLDKLLDGRVFEELAARVELRPGEALVLGYSLPTALRPPLPVADDTPDANKTRSTTTASGDAETAPPPPDLNINPTTLPLDLGRALLTAGKSTREQQRLIVLTVTESR